MRSVMGRRGTRLGYNPRGRSGPAANLSILSPVRSYPRVRGGTEMDLERPSRVREHVGPVAAAWRAPATRWILLIVAAICAVGWVLQLRPLATQWGSVGEWVGGLGAAG